MASVLSVPVFALKEAPTPMGPVLRVSVLKRGAETPELVGEYYVFEDGWNAAIDLATSKEKLKAYDADRIVVDLLADWNANSKGEFGDSDLEGFRQSTIYCPSGVRLTINMNGHTIDRDLEKVEYDGEVIAIGDNANVIINGGKEGDPIIKKGEVAAEGMIGTITGGWNCNGAEILSDGRLLVCADTPSEITINATYNGVTYTMNADVFVGDTPSGDVYSRSISYIGTPKMSVSSRACSRVSSVGWKIISSLPSSCGAIIPLSSTTAKVFVSPLAKSIISVGAAISPSISMGISMVVMINDFLRTRSLNSRAIMIPILFISNS
jgi:hypothetical protein